MKIQAGGVQSPLIAEQSVSSTSDLMSQGRPFYSLTGTNPPMWLLLICANDIVFFIIYLLFSPLFYFLHAKQSAARREECVCCFVVMVRERVQHWSTIILYSFISKLQSHAVLCQSFVFQRLWPQVFRWAIENKQCSWHCNSISNNLQHDNEL